MSYHPAEQRRRSAQDIPATKALLGALIVVYLAQLSIPDLWTEGALFGPLIADGEWWRIVTSGFLHDQEQLLHIAFNGYLLYQLGRLLEPGVGSARFVGIYAAGLVGGSAGALALTWTSPTIGASGAVFGLMGAAMIGLRRHGINPWRTGIGTLVIINLVFTFFAPSVSIGGHVGGLAGGALAAWPVYHPPRRAATSLASQRQRPSTGAPWTVAVGLAGLALYVGVAGPVL